MPQARPAGKLRGAFESSGPPVRHLAENDAFLRQAIAEMLHRQLRICIG